MNKNQLLISIIIPNFNGLHHLKKCIPTILAQTHKKFEIIVVDNNSSDKSISYLKKIPEIVILAQTENLGFAKANNIAAPVAKGEFLFLLNNDTELFPDTLEHLLKCYQPRSIVAAQQVPTWDKKKKGFAGGGMDIFGYAYSLEPSNTRVFYVDGAALFLKKKDFMDLGMFDEKLFMFQEDIDLSWRARLWGYNIISCWGAKLYHYGGGTAVGGSAGEKKSTVYTTSYFRRYHNEKNTVRNILKNYSLPFCIIFLVSLILIHITEMVILMALGKWKLVNCYLSAYRWNIIEFKNTLTLRKKIQKRRKISDWEILKKVYWSYSKLIALSKLGIPKFQ